MQYSGFRIITGFITGNLIEKRNKVDLMASIKRYEVMCHLAISSVFPGAHISVERVYSEARVDKPNGLKTLVINCHKTSEPELEKRVDELCALVKEKQLWVVKKERKPTALSS